MILLCLRFDVSILRRKKKKKIEVAVVEISYFGERFGTLKEILVVRNKNF